MTSTKKPIRIAASALVAGTLVFALAGCSGLGTTASASDSSSTTSQAAYSASSGSASAIDTSNLFSDRDMEQVADTSSATTINVSDGQDVTIDTEGVYVLTGTASNVTVTVEADDNAKVQLVLDGVSITNDDAPAIYVKSADKVFVTTVKGTTNTLKVTGTFVADGDTNLDAAIFAKDDLTLNGEGTLVIESSDNGIAAKDDLTITGGTYEVTAASDAFEANDSIAIANGNFTVTSGKDAFQCKYDEDDTVGFIYVADGTFNINAGDDGMQATTVLQIDGGTFNISAVEGLEGTYVLINDGEITISASDDGINAAEKTTAFSPSIEVNGGTINVTMGSGDTDGFDANGSITINGGTINVTGQSAFDFDTTGTINGGTVTVNGEQVTELTNQMMGGPGGGMQGGAAPSGDMQGGTAPDGAAPGGAMQGGPGQGGMRQ